MVIIAYMRMNTTLEAAPALRPYSSPGRSADGVSVSRSPSESSRAESSSRPSCVRLKKNRLSPMPVHLVNGGSRNTEHTACMNR